MCVGIDVNYTDLDLLMQIRNLGFISQNNGSRSGARQRATNYRK
jgi:hypothetical protein